MSVTSPPRPPRPSDRLDREQVEALVEALFEEARQRARRRRRRYWGVAVLLALLGATAFVVFERSAQSQTGLSARSRLPAATTSSKIAFISTPRRFGRQAPGGLYVVNADGSGKQKLTTTRYATPAWSPDGRRIAFGGRGVHVMNADGTGERMLARNAAAPSWSPDGRTIAFLRGSGRIFGPGQLDVYLVTADGGGERRLARSAWLAAPVWSSDGRKIVFVSRRAGNTEVSVVNADGSGRRNLTRNPADDLDPDLSPDGQKIAFVRNFDVYVMNADGSGQQNLTRNAARDLAPAWSPDGQHIVFERRLGRRKYGPCSGCGRATSFEVHVMNADGSGQRRLTPNRARSGRRPDGHGAHPRWSPDGGRIAFVSERDGNSEIYTMNADGSEQQNVSRNRLVDDNVFAWSPQP